MHLLRLLALLFLGLAAWGAPRPKLVVVLSVDQLSADLIGRWGGDLGGGLGTLLREGVHFAAAYHEHGYTETGPGHSVLLSGRHPAHTGIPENRWLDRATGKFVYCVEDPLVRNLDGTPPPGSSPRWFIGSALPGWLLDQVPGSRAFCVSGKDRSAILMAGPRVSGVFWLSNEGFTSSTAYVQALPPWLEASNKALLEGLRTHRLVWTPLRPREELPKGGRYQLPGRTVVMGLPRLIKTKNGELDPSFWERFRVSPFFDEAILDAANRLLEGERLGRGPGTDLLMVGLSATDYIGHHYGNAGPEMRDQLLRLDARLGAWLRTLRRNHPEAWVVLTSDHGCSDFCERLKERGLPAQRVPFPAFMERVESELSARLQARGPFLRGTRTGSFWLKEEGTKSGRPDRGEILTAALEVLRAQPELAGAWSAAELAALRPDPGVAPGARSLAERLRLSFVPGRSGDIVAALKPLLTFDDPPYLVNHGNPHDPDRRVPMVFVGPWKAGAREEPVRTVDLAPTLAKELGLAIPEPLDGQALELNPAPK
ncbi:MAG: alkaline phosphatase family protein [Acidobacteria bacterium]|nr:alkaline phosphatase family protein [Acidobacteriota bacterium]